MTVSPPARKIELVAADGHRSMAWFAEPVAPARGGIVILHAVCGLTDHMADVCTRWAAAGYTAVAPALYDRLGREIVYPYDQAKEGAKSYGALTEAMVMADIAAATAMAGPAGTVAISGFCSGGTWAWRAAAMVRFPAQVNFYGSAIPSFIDRAPLCPTILHFGDSDHVVSLPQIDAIRTRHPAVQLHVYSGVGHAFEKVEQASYDAAAADLAWTRSIAFMDRHVGDRSLPEERLWSDAQAIDGKKAANSASSSATS